MRSLNFRVRSIRHRAFAWVRSSPAARASLKFIVVLLAVVLPISIVLTQSGLHAAANTITVNSLADSATTSGNGFCDLREAIDNAQSNTDTTGGDCAVGMGNATIYFGVSGTITLVSDLPSIGSSTLTVDGVGQTITIDGDSLYGWQNTIGPLTLNNLTIAHGSSSAITNEGHLTVTNVTFSDNSAGSGDGGAINNLANLTVTNCTFTGNSAPIGEGGAIWNFGTLGITSSMFLDNTAEDGGAIFNSESDNLGITTSTFSGNMASGGTRGGGGIYNYDAPLTVTKSVFSGNSASALDGGGIGDFNGDDTIVNCTFSDNSAADGGGLYTAAASLTLNNGTFSGNSATSGGGIYSNAAASLTLTNSIVADSTSGGDCGGTTTDGGYNIADDTSCSFTATGSVNSTDPMLDGLASNGGPTDTFALKADSPAVDAIPFSHDCPGTDQRLYIRPAPMNAGGKCDTGAFELGGTAPAPTPTATATITPTATASATGTHSATPTRTPTATATGTATPTSTATSYGNCDAKLNCDDDANRNQHADFDRYGSCDSHGHRDGDANGDSDGHLNRDCHRDSHSDRDQDCHPDRDPNRNIDANGDRHANQDANCHRDTGRRAHLGEAEKAEPAGVPERDSIRGNHDQQHRHRPANRQRRRGQAAVHGNQRGQRDRDRCGREPSADNRLLADREGIVERSDRDHEHRRAIKRRRSR